MPAAQTPPPLVRTVYTRMVADLFHRGHVAFLQAARTLGDRLVVYVLDDAHAAAVKRVPLLLQVDRIAVVEACRHVDAVVASGPRVLDLAFMREHGYDLYALGYADAREQAMKLRVCLSLPPAMLATIPYTHGISSSIIGTRIMERARSASVD